MAFKYKHTKIGKFIGVFFNIFGPFMLIIMTINFFADKQYLLGTFFLIAVPFIFKESLNYFLNTTLFIEVLDEGLKVQFNFKKESLIPYDEMVGPISNKGKGLGITIRLKGRHYGILEKKIEVSGYIIKDKEELNNEINRRWHAYNNK